ncbi:hypothetical protein ILYODFUR_007193 [Ilyodon furcidens]|uniref:Uncharacterized protein n=1 Tax=Ilyodon furcidens TaxID=33524 RepID=A0ABV0TKN1_9TELE
MHRIVCVKITPPHALNMLALLKLWCESMCLLGFLCERETDFITITLTTVVPSILLPGLPAKSCFLPLLPVTCTHKRGKRGLVSNQAFGCYKWKEVEWQAHAQPSELILKATVLGLVLHFISFTSGQKTQQNHRCQIFLVVPNPHIHNLFQRK